MTKYAGQDNVYEVAPLLSYEIDHPDLMFTESDRNHATEATVDPTAVTPGLIDRLRQQATVGRSAQAAYFLKELVPGALDETAT